MADHVTCHQNSKIVPLMTQRSNPVPLYWLPGDLVLLRPKKRNQNQEMHEQQNLVAKTSA